MSLTGNFEQVTLDGEVLSVSGSSSGLPDCELVSRAIAVYQDGNAPAHGIATLGLKWTANSLAAPGFEAGDDAPSALAIGCETYFDKNVKEAPAFVTFTWSQIVTIAGK